MEIVREHNGKIVALHHRFSKNIVIRVGFFKWPWRHHLPKNFDFVDLRNLFFYFMIRKKTNAKMVHLRICSFGIAAIINR